MDVRFPVSREKGRELSAKMAALGICEADLEEIFVRSGGRGGQNVNKTSTCVYLKHRPTGIEVKCQAERSQALNRFLARRMMAEKVAAIVLGIESGRRMEERRILRQKRRRSRKAKEKMLRLKRMRSEKKALRRSPEGE
jgi:protein subunit release factor B